MGRSLIWCGVAWITLAAALPAQQSDQEIVKQLTERLAESERRIQALEEKLGMTPAAPTQQSAVPVPPTATEADAQAKAAQAAAEARLEETQGHNMQIPGGGPMLNIRGFFDFNFGVGSIANPLVFPIVDNGCANVRESRLRRRIATFQAGEFDLFITSKLSDHLSFLSEVVLGPDNTNEFGVDIERYQLTYQAEPVFFRQRRPLSHIHRILQHRLPSRELVFDGRRTAYHVPV